MLATSGLFYYLGTDVRLQQVFPNDDSYSCPCPSLMLKCNFSVGATSALWSFGGNIITSPIAGHVINNSMVDQGVSFLYVDHSSYLKTNYRCHASFSDGLRESLPMTSPQPAGKLPLHCHLSAHSLA